MYVTYMFLLACAHTGLYAHICACVWWPEVDPHMARVIIACSPPYIRCYILIIMYP